MILAAGLGTRLKPFTDKHPKSLAVVNNKTILQRNIEYLQQHNIYDVVVNVHHFAQQIIDCLHNNNGFGSKVEISDESSEVLETGGGLLYAKSFLQTNEPFVLLNVDILTNMDLSAMIQMHTTKKPLATLAISSRNSSRCFLFDEQLQLCGWRNTTTYEEKISIQKNNLHPFAFSGIHVIEPTIFNHITQRGKFSMVDVYLSLAHSNTILGYNHTGAVLLDVGTQQKIEDAEKLFV